MKIIYSSRQSGKTTDMVDMVKDDPHGIMITPTLQQARHLLDRLPKNKIMVWREALKISRQANKNLYIDDAEFVLAGMFESNVKVISMSIPEPHYTMEV